MQIVVEDILLNYQILGSKNQKVILILHGWERNLQEWLPLAQLLSVKHRIILVDLPGFGNSSLPKSTFDTNDSAKYVELLLNKLNIKKEVTIIGHSFGGKVAVILAWRDKIKIKKLILIAPSGLPASFKTKSLRILVKVFKNSFGLFLPKPILTVLTNLCASPDYKQAGELGDSFKRIVGQNIVKQLSELRLPITLIWGSQDLILPVNQINSYKKFIPHARTKIIWGSGHDPHLEKAKLLKEVISEML
jgi:pimeloyl-ACP methyl ester carboxylesterase